MIRRWSNSEFREKRLIYFNSDEGKNNARKGALAAIDSVKNKRFHDTKPELEMKSNLEELKIRYIHPFPVWNIEHCYPADFYLPDDNIIIEVDGKFYHNYPIGLEIDKIRNRELEKTGFKVLRFWENEFTADKIKEEIHKCVS
jgi:very-short-patch-repair endonuclease